MTEAQPTDETSASLSEVIARHFDTLIAEVRRQGRASIAAQAAAESCAEAVAALRDDVARMGSNEMPTGARPVEDVVRALLPFYDALERADGQARESLQRLPSQAPPRSLLRRLFDPRGPSPQPNTDLRVLIRGLSVLRAQFEESLRDLGVAFDRRARVPVHAEEHRVVDRRVALGGERPGTVAEVIRAGCELNGRRLREADVVAYVAADE
jgi:molecular chaperone GrpE (heat shock protein)